uniref:Uncharacterized protein n=1 Tax=viral metagenome TaxID=1070528 RepID=A0A6H1ZZN6_9ZZZZ
MNEYDVKRLALIFVIQAEIEGMKTANNQHEQDQPYTDKDFQAKAEELRIVAYKHNEEL